MQHFVCLHGRPVAFVAAGVTPTVHAVIHVLTLMPVTQSFLWINQGLYSLIQAGYTIVSKYGPSVVFFRHKMNRTEHEVCFLSVTAVTLPQI